MEEIKLKKKNYNENVRNAIYRHRQANLDTYNAYMREYYRKKSQDPEWRKNRNAQCRAANRRHREKKKLTQTVKKKGRPIKENDFGLLNPN